MSVGRILAAVVPVTGVTLSTYFYNNNDSGILCLPLRKVFALASGYGEKKTFDEHFPRGGWDKNWDFRHPECLVDKRAYEKASDEEKRTLLSEQKASATRHIILIRHGQYNLDTKDKFLTDLGRAQASRMGERLAGSGLKFNNLIMSTMNRATETALLILEHLPAELPRKSCSLIEEGAPYPPVPELKAWRPTKSEFYVDGSRIESAFRRHIHRARPDQTEDSYEIIVCHANVIRYFICRALQFPPEGWLRMSLGNASITWMSVRPTGHVTIRAVGDNGHLPEDMKTFT